MLVIQWLVLMLAYLMENELENLLVYELEIMLGLLEICLAMKLEELVLLWDCGLVEWGQL